MRPLLSRPSSSLPPPRWKYFLSCYLSYLYSGCCVKLPSSALFRPLIEGILKFTANFDRKLPSPSSLLPFSSLLSLPSLSKCPPLKSQRFFRAYRLPPTIGRMVEVPNFDESEEKEGCDGRQSRLPLLCVYRALVENLQLFASDISSPY